MAYYNLASYGWSTFTISIGTSNQDLVGVKGFSISSTQETEAIYGIGSEPVGISMGNRSYSGSVKFHLRELQRIEDAIPTKDIRDVQGITIFIQFKGGDNLKRIKIEGVVFEGGGIDMAQNNKETIVDIPYKAMKVTNI